MAWWTGRIVSYGRHFRIEAIIEESLRYAIKTKNDDKFNINIEELKAFHIFLVSSGKRYWDKEQDLGIETVQQALFRNKGQFVFCQ